MNIYHQTGWYLEWEGMDIASVGKMKTGMNCYRVNVQEWEGIGMGGVGNAESNSNTPQTCRSTVSVE